jgi:hypothetical protein
MRSVSIDPHRLLGCDLTLEQLARAAWVFGLELDVELVPRSAPALEPPSASPSSPSSKPRVSNLEFDEALAA